MPIPRFNPSDPRVPDQVRPFKIKPLKDGAFSVFSSSSGMAIAAGAMMLRIPQLAMVSLVVSSMALLNAPSVQDPNSSSSPWTSMIMAVSAFFNVLLPRVMDQEPTAAQAATVAA